MSVARLQHDLERGALHRQRAQLLDHALGQPRRSLRPREGQLRGELGALRLRLGGRGHRPLGRDLRVGEPVAIGPAPLGVLEHRLHRAAVLALEPVVAVKALLDLVQPLGVRVQPVQVAAQLDAEVLRLDPQRPQPRRQRVHGGVGPVDAGGQPLSLGQQGGRAGRIGVVGGHRLRARRRPRPAGRPPPAAGRARRRARPDPPGWGRGSRSRRSRTPAGPGRGHAYPRARAAPRARGRHRVRARGQRRRGRAAPGGPRRRTPSSSSSWADATVSRRCSCWPKNASRRPPSSRRSAAVAERPWT